jgi:hypothetical protein
MLRSGDLQAQSTRLSSSSFLNRTTTSRPVTATGLREPPLRPLNPATLNT